MNGILIDTNIYSYAMKGEKEAISVLRKSRMIGISVVSLGELLSGFKGGNKEIENRKELTDFLKSPRVRVFGVDQETAEFYSSILNDLKRAGRPIPSNDVWIAATAFQNNLKIFSKDKHFFIIPEIAFLGF